jgi:hypothetical protein
MDHEDLRVPDINALVDSIYDSLDHDEDQFSQPSVSAPIYQTPPLPLSPLTDTIIIDPPVLDTCSLQRYHRRPRRATSRDLWEIPSDESEEEDGRASIAARSSPPPLLFTPPPPPASPTYDDSSCPSLVKHQPAKRGPKPGSKRASSIFREPQPTKGSYYELSVRPTVRYQPLRSPIPMR